jgi:hypothetical protein
MAMAMPISVGACTSDVPGVAEVDRAAVCGVIAPEDLEAIASVDPLSWGQLTPSRELRMDRLAGTSCEVILKQGELDLKVLEFEEVVPVDKGKRPRCSRVDELTHGWICADEMSIDVHFALPERSLTLGFEGGAGDGLTVAQAERLAVAVNDGIEALDKRHAG